MYHALVWILSWHCNSERISWSGTQQTWRWCENYCQWYTTDCAILTTFTATFKEHKETLIDVIDDLTRHSYIVKLNITNSWCRTKSKAIIGVKNIASYILWQYTTWDEMVASNKSQCVLVLMTTTLTQVFCIKFKQCLFFIFKLITHI